MYAQGRHVQMHVGWRRLRNIPNHLAKREVRGRVAVSIVDCTHAAVAAADCDCFRRCPHAQCRRCCLFLHRHNRTKGEGCTRHHRHCHHIRHSHFHHHRRQDNEEPLTNY